MLRKRNQKNNTEKHIPKKSLGQHFLRSQKALSQIVDAGDISADDIVVEIGPGEGVLTERLLKLAGKVIAIEKDDDLAAKLSEKFAAEITAGKFELLHQDVLDFDFSVMGFYKDLNYKVIANIPYNITGILIRNILTSTAQPELMVLLIQKEVATRIVAHDGKHSLLSLSVHVYGKPKIIDYVAPGSFVPPPKVTSAIIAIDDISRSNFASLDEETLFFKLIHAGFAHKRKQLQANLKELFPSESITAAFEKLDLVKTIRAEDLTLKQWLELVRILK